MMSKLLFCVALFVSLSVVAASKGSLPACSTPGPVATNVCASQLCGPHGSCLAVQFGSPCACDADCTSQNCNTMTGLCAKAPVGGRCWANDDCSSNNCDETCNRCKAVTAGNTCALNSDCTTNLCDTDTFKCSQAARAGHCSLAGDCLSGECDSGYCAASQPEFACTCNWDCVSGSKCLKPTLPDGTESDVGQCLVSAGASCDTDSECGTSFCTTSLASENTAVCTPGGAGAPCAADMDCNDGGTDSLYCFPATTADSRGVCAENLCKLQVCDLNAQCSNAGPKQFKCVCNVGFEGSGLNTGNARAPGCVGVAGPSKPADLVANGDQTPPVQGIPVGSPCVQNFECGSAFCDNGFCAINTMANICQGDNDCAVGNWCAQVSNTHIYSLGATPPAVGHCEVNRCATANGGCSELASCTPVAGEKGRKCACDEANGYFGSGKAKDGDKACVNPCNHNNGGCGATTAGRCVAVNHEDVKCVCFSGFYNNDNNNQKECIDPCLHNNGGCSVYEICTARGPEVETDVACRCRLGFLETENGCAIDYCYLQCQGNGEQCTAQPSQHTFTCSCTTAGFDYVLGTGCVQNHCKDSTAVCGAFAVCTFWPAGDRTGTVTMNPGIDKYTTCVCDYGFTGNGFSTQLMGGTGCTAVACAAANVASIEHAVVGNCDGTQTTRDYCVVGCETGYKPSVNPEAQCVGQAPGVAAIEFRQYTCKRDHKHDESDNAWLCSATSCVPNKPSVGWKHDSGRIGLRWLALGPSVATLQIQYQLSSGAGPILSENVTPMPGYATTREIDGLTPGAQYAFWLVVVTNEGMGGSTLIGNKLLARV